MGKLTIPRLDENTEEKCVENNSQASRVLVIKIFLSLTLRVTGIPPSDLFLRTKSQHTRF